MPFDISTVTVTFGNGIKREEYGPLKKAEVSITVVVGQGEDGALALNYAGRLAQDKVRELLTIQGSAAAAPAASPADTATPEPAVQLGEAQAETQKRTRRTKAQIEADAAAAAAAQLTPATETQAETVAPTSEAAPAADEDEWAAAAPETVTITDQELNHTCSVTAERVKDALKVKGTIAKFAPAGDAWDPTKPGGRKFTVNDIPQVQRADFIAQLKALT